MDDHTWIPLTGILVFCVAALMVGIVIAGQTDNGKMAAAASPALFAAPSPALFSTDPVPTVTAFATPTATSETTCGMSLTDANEVAYDPCEAASSYLAAGALINLQGSSLYKKWAAANPGELQRFKAYLSDPRVWSSDLPSSFPMKTAFGSMLRDLVTTCKAVKCTVSGLPAVPATYTPSDTKGPTVPTVTVSP